MVLRKIYPAGEYLNLSRERDSSTAGYIFLKHCLLSSVKERMAIQEIENDAYDLEPEAFAAAVAARQ